MIQNSENMVDNLYMNMSSVVDDTPHDEWMSEQMLLCGGNFPHDLPHRRNMVELSHTVTYEPTIFSQQVSTERNHSRTENGPNNAGN